VLRFTDNNSSGRALARRTFTAQTDSVTFEWRVNTAAQWPYFGMRSGSTNATEMYFYSGGLRIRTSSGSDAQLAAMSTNTWYTIKVVANIGTDLCNVFLDGTQVGFNIGFRNAVSSIDNIEFASSNSQQGDVTIDDVKVTSP